MFNTSIRDRFKRVSEKELKIQPTVDIILVPSKFTLTSSSATDKDKKALLKFPVMTGEYKEKIEKVKEIIASRGRAAYLKGWVINETDEEMHDYIIHFFNVIKQDVYIIDFKKDGIHVKTNDVKHHYDEFTIGMVVKNYLLGSHEDFLTTNDDGNLVTRYTPDEYPGDEVQDTSPDEPKLH